MNSLEIHLTQNSPKDLPPLAKAYERFSGDPIGDASRYHRKRLTSTRMGSVKGELGNEACWISWMTRELDNVSDNKAGDITLRRSDDADSPSQLRD